MAGLSNIKIFIYCSEDVQDSVVDTFYKTLQWDKDDASVWAAANNASDVPLRDVMGYDFDHLDKSPDHIACYFARPKYRYEPATNFCLELSKRIPEFVIEHIDSIEGMRSVSSFFKNGEEVKNKSDLLNNKDYVESKFSADSKKSVDLQSRKHIKLLIKRKSKDDLSL